MSCFVEQVDHAICTPLKSSPRLMSRDMKGDSITSSIQHTYVCTLYVYITAFPQEYNYLSEFRQKVDSFYCSQAPSDGDAMELA